VKGMSDALFARASAGAFDFGMREVQSGKLIRPGKPPLGTKDGWMTELEFRVNGGDLGPLQKDEVAFYKQLVPEAFAGDKVHLQKLWDGLGKVGEQVKVVTYGQDGLVSQAKAKFDEAIGELDRLGFEWGNDEQAQLAKSSEMQKWFNQAKANREEANRASAGPRATSYYNQISSFDTKKYPVVRVDVVLPKQALTYEEWLKGRTGTQELYSKFTQEVPNGELWTQDNLHENLPNTLGWAMVQVVPHPVTGEKVMFVGELQSRWSQERRGSIEDRKNETKEYLNRPVKDLWPESSVIWKYLKSKFPAAEHKTAVFTEEMWKEEAARTSIADHPLLPIHQNLILKAVIKEAQKQGISKVAVSGSKEALMTERLDAPGSFEGPFATAELAQVKADALNGDSDTGWKVFNHSTPTEQRWFASDKQGGFDVAYDTTMPSIMSKLTGESGKVEDFGPHKNQLAPSGDETVFNDDAGEQPQASLNKGSPVFRTPSGTPKTNATARVFDISNPSPRLDTLFARNQGQVYGVAAPKSSKLFINSKAFQGYRASDRIASVFAHEQSHHSIQKAREGKYGPEAKLLADKVDAWVSAANPRMRKNVEDVVVELHLGKDLARLDGIRDVLNNPNSEEWIANVMGAYAFGMVKSRAPKQAFAMLPKPIREFADWMVGHFQSLVKGAQSWMRLSGGDYQGAKNVKDLFDTIRRSYRQAEWDAAQAERFLDIEPSTMIERGHCHQGLLCLRLKLCKPTTKLWRQRGHIKHFFPSLGVNRNHPFTSNLSADLNRIKQVC